MNLWIDFILRVIILLQKVQRDFNSNTVLHRQPFQTFPQTLLLRETFTVDLLKGLYILESKAGFHGNREVIHTLTLGYKPPSPFVSLAQVNLLMILRQEVREYLITLFFSFLWLSSYLGLFCAGPSFQLWHCSLRLRNLCDRNQQPGKLPAFKTLTVISIEPESSTSLALISVGPSNPCCTNKQIKFQAVVQCF